MNDFLIAISEFSFTSVDDMKEKLKCYKQIELVLYNIKSGNVHKILLNLVPNEGLGIEISQGILHNLKSLI